MCHNLLIAPYIMAYFTLITIQTDIHYLQWLSASGISYQSVIVINVCAFEIPKTAENWMISEVEFVGFLKACIGKHWHDVKALPDKGIIKISRLKPAQPDLIHCLKIQHLNVKAAATQTSLKNQNSWRYFGISFPLFMLMAWFQVWGQIQTTHVSFESLRQVSLMQIKDDHRILLNLVMATCNILTYSLWLSQMFLHCVAVGMQREIIKFESWMQKKDKRKLLPL